MSFHFGLLGLHVSFVLAFWPFIVLSFCHLGGWPVGPFPFILAFWRFISFEFWPFQLWKRAAWPGPCPKIAISPLKFAIFPFQKFGLFAKLKLMGSFPGTHSWAFISFHFGLLGVHVPFILAFWAFMSFCFGLLQGFIFFHFGLLAAFFSKISFFTVKCICFAFTAFLKYRF